MGLIMPKRTIQSFLVELAARLYTVFEIMDDQAAAVKSFGQSAAATG
jgi:hypothetical protein